MEEQQQGGSVDDRLWAGVCPASTPRLRFSPCLATSSPCPGSCFTTAAPRAAACDTVCVARENPAIVPPPPRPRRWTAAAAADARLGSSKPRRTTHRRRRRRAKHTLPSARRRVWKRRRWPPPPPLPPRRCPAGGTASGRPQPPGGIVPVGGWPGAGGLLPPPQELLPPASAWRSARRLHRGYRNRLCRRHLDQGYFPPGPFTHHRCCGCRRRRHRHSLPRLRHPTTAKNRSSKRRRCPPLPPSPLPRRVPMTDAPPLAAARRRSP